MGTENGAAPSVLDSGVADYPGLTAGAIFRRLFEADGDRERCRGIHGTERREAGIAVTCIYRHPEG